jgi:hypothetical protein
MKKRLLMTSIGIFSAALFSGYSAHAQTTVTTSSTTPLATSSAGDITINSGDGITVSGANAVTVDSNNSVTNSGSITVNDASPGNGILVTGVTNGVSITNSGSITVTDSTLATAIPLTGGENRYGIQINSASPYSGTITNASGASIVVRGNDSAGIYLAQGGLNGSIINTGAIGVTGNGSFGILTNANAPIAGYINITGNITSLGTTSAAGVNAGAIQLNGTLSGQLYIDAVVRATGYFSDGVVVTTRPTTLTGFSPNYSQLSGPSVAIQNNIASAGYAGGIFVDTLGDLQSLGTAAALQIAPATTSGSVEIGNGSGTYGLINSGAIESNGIYDGFTSNALQVGGNGGAAKIDGGIQNLGRILSTAYAANATGITLSSGASVSSIVNSGTINSTVNLGFNSLAGGVATAILDNGGALSTITNTGVITATNASGNAYALDLRGDTIPVTVYQNGSGTSTASSLTGAVAFGSAGATFNVNSGILTGGIDFGSTANNTLNINGATVLGPLTEEAGGTVAVNISNGRLASTSLSNVTLKSLQVSSSGELDFATSPTGQNGSLTVLGAMMVSTGAKIGLEINSKITAPESFTVIQAPSSTFAGQAAFVAGQIPYFYNVSIVTNPTAGTVGFNLSDRTFAQAGVQGSSSAYNAVFASSYADSGIRDAFSTASTQQSFKNLYRQMLPSYSGGLFESLAQGAGALVQAQTSNPIVQSSTRGGGWAQQIGFGEEQSNGSAPGYHGGGIGFAFGWEAPASDISTWGISVSYMRTSVSDFDTGPNNKEVGSVYGTGIYWRESDGGLHTDASLNAGIVQMNSERNFAGTDLLGAAVSRTADAAWNGGLAQAHLGVSYEEPVGDYFIKPSLSGDYFVLYSGSSSEHNGGSAFDLNVASNTGKQGSVVGGITVGTSFADGAFKWNPELMVGYKTVFGGPDNITAQFASGSSFALSPASQQGGAVAHVGVHGGNKFSDFAFEAGGEDRGEYHNFDGRLVARFRF